MSVSSVPRGGRRATLGDTASGPEVLEVEATRQAAASLAGRTFGQVERTDPLVVIDGVDAVVPGATIESVQRRGKLLVVCTDGPTIGV